MAEPFRQWVIEDRFAAGRPCWERVGAEFVADVSPYEDMKLRLLNGSHSAMAYLGALAGWEFIWEVIGDSSFRRFVDCLMDEASTTLSLPAGVDVARYRRDLAASALREAGAKPSRKRAMVSGVSRRPAR